MTFKQFLPEGPFALVGAVAVLYIFFANLSVTVPLLIFGAIGYYASLRIYKKIQSEKANVTTGPTGTA